ncbi:winged helix-turn-helix transcriptional regulator, partial [bacterium]|nr:winged helix-turn-helix transcriptional regulator [bacterium]
QNRLCKLLYKDKSNMARLVGILEKKELISKVQNGQINSIIITPKGRQLRDLITPLMNNSRKNYLKDIPEDDMYTCIKVLNTIQKNLENEHDNKKGQE